MKFDESKAIDKLKSMLNKSRFEHSLRVRDEAQRLAKAHDYNLEKASIAGLLHDCAKGLSSEDMNNYIKKYHIDLDLVSQLNIKLVHGPIGSKLAEDIFNIGDKEILDAIEYHTYGRKNMTSLDMIIYLADLIEPKRDYQGVDFLRELAYKNLEEACLWALEDSMKMMLRKKILIHPNSLETRNYLIYKFSNERD